MKKLLICLLAAVLLLVPAVVLADLIIEEKELDAYYDRVKDECEYFGEYVLANGPEGYTAVYQKPGSNRAIYFILNGQRTYLEYAYNGWALLDIHDGGWIRLSETMADDLAAEFFKQHESECEYPDPPAVQDVSSLKDDKNVLYWDYPGAPLFDSIYDLTCLTVNTSETAHDELISVLTFDCTWRDAEGRLWGYSADGFTFRNGGWICLTDPYNAYLPADLIEVEGMVPPAEVSELPKPYVEISAWVWWALAILCVIVSAVALIIIFSVRNRRRRKNAEARLEENAEEGRNGNAGNAGDKGADE